jgi:hypothetical protein
MRTATISDFKKGTRLFDKKDPTIEFYIYEIESYKEHKLYAAKVWCKERFVGEINVNPGESNFYLVNDREK